MHAWLIFEWGSNGRVLLLTSMPDWEEKGKGVNSVNQAAWVASRFPALPRSCSCLVSPCPDCPDLLQPGSSFMNRPLRSPRNRGTVTHDEEFPASLTLFLAVSRPTGPVHCLRVNGRHLVEPE